MIDEKSLSLSYSTVSRLQALRYRIWSKHTFEARSRHCQCTCVSNIGKMYPRNHETLTLNTSVKSVDGRADKKRKCRRRSHQSGLDIVPTTQGQTSPGVDDQRRRKHMRALTCAYKAHIFGDESVSLPGGPAISVPWLTFRLHASPATLQRSYHHA